MLLPNIQLLSPATGPDTSHRIGHLASLGVLQLYHNPRSASENQFHDSESNMPDEASLGYYEARHHLPIAAAEEFSAF